MHFNIFCRRCFCPSIAWRRGYFLRRLPYFCLFYPCGGGKRNGCNSGAATNFIVLSLTAMTRGAIRLPARRNIIPNLQAHFVVLPGNGRKELRRGKGTCVHKVAKVGQKTIREKEKHTHAKNEKAQKRKSSLKERTKRSSVVVALIRGDGHRKLNRYSFLFCSCLLVV